MKNVDYAKLSEQYARFFVGIGGVSITVITLILSLTFTQPQTRSEENSRAFLVAALVVATVSCFVGAHMMAETAAFFTHYKKKLRRKRPGENPPLGEHLFFLASSNIFIAVLLVLFSLLILPAASGRSYAANIKTISLGVFVAVCLGAIVWIALAIWFRMPYKKKRNLGVGIAGIGLGLILFYLFPYLRQFVFAPAIIFTGLSLIYFACIFRDSGKAFRLLGLHQFIASVIIFLIAFSYSSMSITGVIILFYE